MSKLFIAVAAFTLEAVIFANSLLAAETMVGRWVENSPNARVKMDPKVVGPFGGWQTSDLTFDAHTQTWWSIGDQNCRESQQFFLNGASHRGRFIYRVTQIALRVEAEPIPIWWERKDPEFTAVDQSFKGSGTEFIDFEGIAADPTRPNCFFACTEGPEPWLVELEFRASEHKAVVTRTVRISTVGNHDRNRLGEPVKADANKRWEAITISADGKTIYLATEWVDSPARIYSVSMTDFRSRDWNAGADGKWTPPKVFPSPFITGGIAGEITGMCFGEHKGKTYLLVLERNTPGTNAPPSLYLFDIAEPQAPKDRYTLLLRAPFANGAPQGFEIRSASPEGVACDRNGRLLLIGDPDKSFYRATAPDNQNSMLDNLIPLVFETRLANFFQ